MMPNLAPNSFFARHMKSLQNILEVKLPILSSCCMIIRNVLFCSFKRSKTSIPFSSFSFSIVRVSLCKQKDYLFFVAGVATVVAVASTATALDIACCLLLSYFSFTCKCLVDLRRRLQRVKVKCGH